MNSALGWRGSRSSTHKSAEESDAWQYWDSNHRAR
jgi:hypothetical protein